MNSVSVTCGRRLLSPAIILSFTSLLLGTTSRLLVAADSDQECTHETRAVDLVKNINVLGFVPQCLQDDDQSSRALTKEDLEECDVLVRAAIELAVEKFNSRNDTLLRSDSNSCLDVQHLPDNTGPDEQIDLEPIINTFGDGNILGVVGPVTATVADFWTQLFHRADLLTVSYNVTSTVSDSVSTFYRTLPSDRAANFGRILLLLRNKWYRIGAVYSSEREYVKQAEDFNTFGEILCNNNIDFALLVSFSTSPVAALRGIKRNGINIIVAFFGPNTARNVLCLAYSEGLVSSDHAWILPSYFNPSWWKLQSKGSNGSSGSDCSDDLMETILESVIFINSVKFPSIDMTLEDFHSQLLTKAVDLFPSLTEENLKPYLLRSRATNAYDAVTLLAKSVDVAFKQGGDSCTDTRLTQVALEKVFMECEYCRLFSGCLLNETRTSHCLQLCGSDYIPDLTSDAFAELYTNLSTIGISRPDYILNTFGQIFYTQFINGEECPVGLLWPSSSHGNQTLGNKEQIYTLEELEEAPCAVRLNLTKKLFIKEGSGCPLTFQWRDSTEPPVSHTVTYFAASLAEIIIIGLMSGLGLVIAVMFIIFNIVSRDKPVVKASSPWLNLILLTGIIILLPSTLFKVLVTSSVTYGFSSNLNPLCYLSLHLYHIGETIFLATLIVKNWRIHLIFRNKELKDFGSRLSDKRLMFNIFIFVLPVVILLITWDFHDIRTTTSPIPNSLPQVIVTYCTSTYFDRFTKVAAAYNIFLLIFLFILTLLSLNSPMKIFQREARQSYVAVSITLVPVPFLIITLVVLNENDLTMNFIRSILWIEFTLSVLIPTLIMLVLFLPNVYKVFFKQRVKKKMQSFRAKSEDIELQESNERSHRYHSLRLEVASLKNKLQETNTKIAEVLANKESPDKQQESTSRLGIKSTDESREAVGHYGVADKDAVCQPDTLSSQLQLSSTYSEPALPRSNNVLETDTGGDLEIKNDYNVLCVCDAHSSHDSELKTSQLRLVEFSDGENSLSTNLNERHTNFSASDRSSCDFEQIESEHVKLNAPT